MGIKISPNTITERDSKSLKNYFSELTTIPLLTVNEEIELAHKAADGDKDAREKLVKHNLRFVVSVAKQFTGRGVTFEDLINEGNLGLIKAAEKFDPTRGFKFISYAVWWIRQSILQYIKDNARTIRLPHTRQKQTRLLNIEAAELEQELERPPTYVELLERIEKSEDIKLKDLDFYDKNLMNMTSYLDAPLTSDGKFTMNDTISDVSFPTPTEELDMDDSNFRLNLALSKLDAREAYVLTKTYGLDDEDPLKSSDIGALLGISGQRVLAIKKRALRKLQHKYTNQAKWFLEQV